MITLDGTIYNTRNVECRAIADAGYEKSLFSDENTEHIHIAFVGDDKPTPEQTRSMKQLGNFLASMYPINNIYAHNERAQKNAKESFDHWYGSKESFTKDIYLPMNPTPVVVINGKENIYASYAWRTWQDKDFILTMYAESGWDLQRYGDKDNPEPGSYSY